MSTLAGGIQSLNWGWRICFQDGSLTQLLVGGLCPLAFGWKLHPHQVALSHGLLECLHNMAVDLPRVRDPRESKMEATVSPMTESWNSQTFTSPLIYWLSHTLKGRGPGLHLLKGEVSKNLLTCFKTMAPTLALFFSSCGIVSFSFLT